MPVLEYWSKEDVRAQTKGDQRVASSESFAIVAVVRCQRGRTVVTSAPWWVKERGQVDALFIREARRILDAILNQVCARGAKTKPSVYQLHRGRYLPGRANDLQDDILRKRANCPDVNACKQGIQFKKG